MDPISIGMGVAGAASSLFGGGSSGGPPKWAKRAQRAIVDEAGRVRSDIADFTPDELAAMEQVRGLQGFGDADMAEAQANASRYATGIGANDIRAFYNPFEDDVVGAFQGDLEEQRRRAAMQRGQQFSAAGAFGDDREGVYRANLDADYDRTGALAIGDMRMQGYNMASQNALNSRSLALTGNDQLSRLIEQRRMQRYGDADVLSQQGFAQRTRQQQVNDNPMRMLEFRSGMVAPALGIESNPRQDPIAGAVQGFQGGYRAGQSITDWWNSRKTPTQQPAQPKSGAVWGGL